MPIKIPADFPAFKVLKKEGVMVMSEHQAAHQDIRPLRVGLLNLMPKKIQTEKDLNIILEDSNSGNIAWNIMGSTLLYAADLIPEIADDILNIDSLTYAGNLDSLDEISSSSNYNFQNIDICNLHKVKEAIFDYQPDSIIHLAAESHVDRSLDSPKPFIESNIVGTFNILDSALKHF